MNLRRRKVCVFFLVVWCFCLAAALVADTGDAGQPGAFLRDGVGARPLGLGHAFVALADDASASYWNPAGLALLDRPSLASMLSQMSLNRQFNYLCLALPVSVSCPAEAYVPMETAAFPESPFLGGWGAWSLSWINFSMGQDFEGRSADTSSHFTFGDQQNAYVLSHGRALASWLALGASVKILSYSLADSHAQGMGFDLGILALLHEHLRLGFVASDLGSRQVWDTGYAEDFPSCVRLGLASAWFHGALCFSGQIQGVEGEQPRLQVGAEFWLFSILAGRIGVNNGSLSAGGSGDLKLFKKRIRIDYGFAVDPMKLGDTQRLSLLLWF